RGAGHQLQWLHWFLHASGGPLCPEQGQGSALSGVGLSFITGKNMPYVCRIERDSVSPEGVRLTTFVISYPREVLAEVRTHRILPQHTQLEFMDKSMTTELSMNSASSRAIPVEKMIQAVLDD